MQKNKFFYLLSFLFLLSLDQISKYIIRTKSGFYICNENLAFGLKFNYFFIIIAFVFLIFFIYHLKLKIENFKVIPSISFLLILSGAIANIIDRLYFGCVIDFIDLKFWPVFNFADIYITIGIIAILIMTMNKEQ
ncbi:MAG: signal peptidase II [Parcubacteria group bacterium]|jgi:signal peptidase II